ncbi:hypothetical protein BDN71DRAFT_1431723 [Pleurotus eryngii]|uniref:Uncharacterized protein n=1 Tax=Pleurotus eryngii TaxID=5323 RepID=A0A9P5ZXI4_PLEER|nr:hypothetical protein BDN71DRAFT_1431723 [Pleurotus eryngii]
MAGATSTTSNWFGFSKHLPATDGGTMVGVERGVIRLGDQTASDDHMSWIGSEMLDSKRYSLHSSPFFTDELASNEQNYKSKRSRTHLGSIQVAGAQIGHQENCGSIADEEKEYRKNIMCSYLSKLKRWCNTSAADIWRSLRGKQIHRGSSVSVDGDEEGGKDDEREMGG